MTIRAHIEIKLDDNEIIKYVNSTVQDELGKSDLYYSYSNEDGHKFEDQTGPGKAKGDYDTLTAQLGGTGLLTWPEGGTTLIRKNTSNSVAASSRIIRTVPVNKVTSINLIEKEVNEFQQLDIDRSV